jgi:hypothetical protein
MAAAVIETIARFLETMIFPSIQRADRDVSDDARAPMIRPPDPDAAEFRI